MSEYKIMLFKVKEDIKKLMRKRETYRKQNDQRMIELINREIQLAFSIQLGLEDILDYKGVK